MKCKICGHRTSGDKALANMGKHYRKAHPKVLARKRSEAPRKRSARNPDVRVDEDTVYRILKREGLI